MNQDVSFLNSDNTQHSKSTGEINSIVNVVTCEQKHEAGDSEMEEREFDAGGGNYNHNNNNNGEKNRSNSYSGTTKTVKQVNIVYSHREVIIHKKELVYATTFDELFNSNLMEHDFKNNAKAQDILLRRQKSLKFTCTQTRSTTIIEYNFDLFAIVLRIPNDFFILNLDKCPLETSLLHYRQKCAKYEQILSLNDYKIDVIKLYAKHLLIQSETKNDFIYKIYEPSEIDYTYKGFVPQGNTPADRVITKERCEMNLMRTFGQSLMREYRILTRKQSDYEADLNSFLVSQKGNNNTDSNGIQLLSDGKYYKLIEENIYFIKDNIEPHLLVSVFHDRICVENMRILHLKPKWLQCPKVDICQYFVDLMHVLTATTDYPIAKIPVTTNSNYTRMSTRIYESDVFLMNLSAEYSQSAQFKAAFHITLMYKLVCEKNILSMVYVGAVQFVRKTNNQNLVSTKYTRYGKHDKFSINFEPGTSQMMCNYTLAQYQNMVGVDFKASEKCPPQGPYAFTVEPNLKLPTLTLFLRK